MILSNVEDKPSPYPQLLSCPAGKMTVFDATHTTTTKHADRCSPRPAPLKCCEPALIVKFPPKKKKEKGTKNSTVGKLATPMFNRSWLNKRAFLKKYFNLHFVPQFEYSQRRIWSFVEKKKKYPVCRNVAGRTF